jgi:hypothetical protein
MPLDPTAVIRLHKEFNSEQAIDRQLVNPAINTAMQVSGPTMNSTESVSEKKSELLRIIDDQVRNGTFETVVEAQEVKDLPPVRRKSLTSPKSSVTRRVYRSAFKARPIAGIRHSFAAAFRRRRLTTTTP